MMGNKQKNQVSSEKSRIKEKELEKELKACMHCKFFWGNSHRCAMKKCYKDDKESKIKENESKMPDKCSDCPYGNPNGYCFPCMKDLLGSR